MVSRVTDRKLDLEGGEPGGVCRRRWDEITASGRAFAAPPAETSPRKAKAKGR